MNKKILLIGFLFVLAFSSCNSNPEESKKETETEKNKKPNIIYILADDLGYGDVGYNGQEKIETPNIDKLAAEGMIFTQHYSGSTVCAPSRSVLMTGQHTGHTPIRGNKEYEPEGQHPMKAKAFTIAEMLKKAGYTTGAFGKWGLGFIGTEGDPNNQGFDEFFGYNCQRQSHRYYPMHLWHNSEKVVLKGNNFKSKRQFAPELIHKEALKFIENNKDKPFFMFYPNVIPHAEIIMPEGEMMEKYRGKFEETPYVNDRPGANYGDEPFEVKYYCSQPEPLTTFAAMVSYLDKQVGEVMAKLEELGLAENTIIMFTSDNGPHQEGGADPDFFNSNGNLKGYKRDLYEGGICVPMVAAWKGTIKPGTKTDHISAFWDIMPTLAELTGIETPENIDGISFLPTLLGNEKEQKEHDYLYWEFHEKGGRMAVRKGYWKAVKYDVRKKPEKIIELYDLSKDPGEENNLAEEFPEVVKELTDIMANARTESEVFDFNKPRK